MYQFEPIGILRTCFREKFGIPRQPGLVPHASGILTLNDHPYFHLALREIETFSHLWLVFVFHADNSKNWKPSIRPPRLGGAKKVGVLASRSPHRPNPIGLSAVKLEKVDYRNPSAIELHLSGVDCLDGTPVLDIKPYLEYTDSIPTATSGWANHPIQRVPVKFTEKALELISQQDPLRYPNLLKLIQEILELDPRPAFQQIKLSHLKADSQGTRYGFKLFDFDIQWEIRDDCFHVFDLLIAPRDPN